MSLPRASAASAALGAALAALALLAGGGNDVGRVAILEVVVVLAGGAVVALAALLARLDGPLHGSVCLALFAAFTAVTALSLTWSIAPDESLEEAARSFAYLAIFAAAVAGARLAPGAAPVVARAILLAAVAVVLYALASRVWPSSFGGQLGPRLGEPYDYWNALGATAAVGIPAALWLGVAETGRTLTRALALPALGLLILTLLLTQSRGALVAASVAALLWLLLVPRRLHSIGLLLAAGAVAAPVAAWALAKDAFTEALQPLSAREAVAGEFGLLVLVMIVVLAVGGLALEQAAAGRAMSLVTRRRIGIAAVAAACLLSLVALTSVATSSRGLSGTISDRVDELTGDTGAPPRGAARLGSLSSARGGYWRQAREVFESRPSIGAGAGSFAIARLPHAQDARVSRHAHGFIAQTAADMGLVGLAVALLLLGAWLVSAARALGLGRRRAAAPRPEWWPERAALTALVLCVVAFGIHSTVDWTWFVPGPSAMALVAAGFVAGRGPLPGLGSNAARPAARPARRIEPARVAGALAVLVGAGLCAWAVWQPEAAERASDRALERLAEHDIDAAARAADHAREVNPYSPEPLYVKASVLLAAKREKDAYRTLERAVIEHPRDPATWLRLAHFELDELDLPARAIESAGGALRLDPNSRRAALITQRATEQLGADTTAARPQPRRSAGAHLK